MKVNFGKLEEVYKKVIAQGRRIIPVVVVEVRTKEVLMLAYADKEAVRLSLEKKMAIFWSTSRNELWEKGSTSGNRLELFEISMDCEGNSFLYLVRAQNNCGACHTKDELGNYRKSCFFTPVNLEIL